MKCYVDELSLESKDRSQHFNDFKEVFECLRKNQYKMNRLKCTFKVTLEKFLGFIVWHIGIEVDPDKRKVIPDMPPPHNLLELRGLQGRLTSIQWHISNLSGRCQPFSRLIKK